MKKLNSLKYILIPLLMAAALGACDKPGPAETAGKNIDLTVNKAAQKVGNAVANVGQTMTEKSNQAGVAISDTEITARVKAVIFAGSGLDTLQVSVKTMKGVVTLSGSVDTRAQSDSAKAMAKEVSGVSQVDNQLKVKPG